jgi:hypothetical protein
LYCTSAAAAGLVATFLRNILLFLLTAGKFLGEELNGGKLLPGVSKIGKRWQRTSNGGIKGEGDERGRCGMGGRDVKIRELLGKGPITRKLLSGAAKKKK